MQLAEPATTSGRHADGDEQALKSSSVGFEPYLSVIAQGLLRSPIRSIALQMQAKPGCLSLAGGRPPADVFPASLQAKGEELMNYSGNLAIGTQTLRDWAQAFVERFHSPPGGWSGRDIVLTSGNTDGMAKAVMLLANPGDAIIADDFTYPGIMACAVPLGRAVFGVTMDQEGMTPQHLQAMLESGLPDGQTARLLYLCPHGQNPTGAVMSKVRKEAIYAVARKHNLTILEDDPYFFVNLPAPSSVARRPLRPEDMPGTDAFPESFLSLDVDGRVLRLDSVSKFLAPGLRLGWATGHRSLMEKWKVLSEVMSWSISGVQQETFLSTMRDLGGEGGLHDHLQQLQCTYARRRDCLLMACDQHLQGLCRWNAPHFGMFLWLEVLCNVNTSKIINTLISEYGIAMVPGSGFRASGSSEADSGNAFFRLSFSLVTEDMADTAMSRLKTALQASTLSAPNVHK